MIGNKMNKCYDVLISHSKILSPRKQFFLFLLPIFIIDDHKVQL